MYSIRFLRSFLIPCLPFAAGTEADVRKFFSPVKKGTIVGIRLPKWHDSGPPPPHPILMEFFLLSFLKGSSEDTDTWSSHHRQRERRR